MDKPDRVIDPPAVDAANRASYLIREAIIIQLEDIDLSVDPDNERKVIELQRQLFTNRMMRLNFNGMLQPKDEPGDEEGEY